MKRIAILAYGSLIEDPGKEIKPLVCERISGVQYRLCQRTAHADAHRELPDGEIIYTKDEFIEALGGFLSDWAAQEGRIRLLLPTKLLSVHEEAVARFNEFKRAVHEFSPAEPVPRKKEEAFRGVEEVKSKLEAGLREFLRTESLLK